jgi:hypothetical protein
VSEVTKGYLSRFFEESEEKKAEIQGRINSFDDASKVCFFQVISPFLQ